MHVCVALFEVVSECSCTPDAIHIKGVARQIYVYACSRLTHNHVWEVCTWKYYYESASGYNIIGNNTPSVV